MPTKNVNLSTQQTKFIRKSIHVGRYRNASEVVRAGLRLLEQQEHEDKLKLKALRRLTTESFGELDRGEFEEVDVGSLDNFIQKVDARARASRRQ